MTTSNTYILYYRNKCRKCGKIFKTPLPFNVICKKCTNKKNKKEENEKLKAENKTIIEDNDTLNKWVDELKAQIEKMKCCGNCKIEVKDEEYPCSECDGKSKWELAE